MFFNRHLGSLGGCHHGTFVRRTGFFMLTSFLEGLWLEQPSTVIAVGWQVGPR